MYTTLVSPQILFNHLSDPSWVIVDCRYDFESPCNNRPDYYASHIPGAVYVDLDEDLSAPVIKGFTGRHPLPEPTVVRELFSQLGIGAGIQVVVYDAAGGALAAARLWWMLRWLGHLGVAVLDGGWQNWLAEGYTVVSGIQNNPARAFYPMLNPEMLIDVQEVERIRQQPGYCLLDARTNDRFHGENETIDPVAGHIPGAISAFYGKNLNSNLIFRSAQELREAYTAIIGDIPAEQVIVYCGSGVTAAHNILAILHAGLGQARLYPGSWSEWITDPSRLVST